MKCMVVGFACNSAGHLTMLHKRRGPPGVFGHWNGPGGAIEEDETPCQAMVREFREETGVVTEPSQWIERVVLCGQTFQVTFFIAKIDAIPETTTDEEVIQINLVELMHKRRIVENLRWIIPLCFDLGVAGPIRLFETTRR